MNLQQGQGVSPQYRHQAQVLLKKHTVTNANSDRIFLNQ